jgi:hypothetical protein
MVLDAKRLALACAMATAILWFICSASVVMMPALSLEVTGHLVHADLSGTSWSLTWGGFLIGLVTWTLTAAVSAWLIAWVYNRLGRSSTS